MPITRKSFQQGSFKSVAKSEGRYNHPISIFLRKESGKAFKAEEIAQAVGLNPSSVRAMVRKLIADGHIEKKVPYYMWKIVKSDNRSAKPKKKKKRR